MSTNILQQLLDKFGIKQQHLCETAKVNKGTLSNIINCKNEPNISVCLRIAKSLNMRVEDIFFEDGLDDISLSNKSAALVLDNPSDNDSSNLKDIISSFSKKLDDLVMSKYNVSNNSCFFVPNYNSKTRSFNVSLSVKSKRYISLKDFEKLNSEDVYVSSINIDEDNSKEFRIKSGKFKSQDVAEAM